MPPLPDSDSPISKPGGRLYPNLDPYIKASPTAPFEGQLHTHQSGMIPPMRPESLHSFPVFPDASHTLFPSPGMSQQTPVPYNPSRHPVSSTGHPDPPHCSFPPSNPFISEKAVEKIKKEEYKAAKKIAKIQRKAEKKAARDERRAARAERRAHNRNELSTRTKIALGLGGFGVAALAYNAVRELRRHSSCSTSSCSGSD